MTRQLTEYRAYLLASQKKSKKVHQRGGVEANHAADNHAAHARATVVKQPSEDSYHDSTQNGDVPRMRQDSDSGNGKKEDDILIDSEKKNSSSSSSLIDATSAPAQIHINLTKVADPDTSAACLAEFIVEQLERRVPFRRALKQAVQRAERALVKGIKVQVSGRLNGAEIARSERIHKGQVPLHTLRAKMEYKFRTARTIYGLLGVKVWIFKGFL